MIKNRKELLGAALFLGSGLFLGILSLRLHLWGRLGPTEGFFPLLTAGVIVVASLVVLVRSLDGSRPRSETREPLQGGGRSESPSRVWSYSFLLLFYGLLLEPVGFIIVTPCFLTVALRFVERQSWRRTVLIGLASIVISYLLFSRFLGVPLPRGLLE